MKQLTNDQLEQILEKPRVVQFLEDAYGVKFHNAHTGSWYSHIKGSPVRVSNHASKFKERNEKYYEKSFDFGWKQPIHQVICELEEIDPFLCLESGVTITHRLLGPMTFVKYHPEKGCAEVLNLNNEIKLYYTYIFIND